MPLPFFLWAGGAPVCAGGFMAGDVSRRPPASPGREPSCRSSVRMTQRPGRPGSPVRRPRPPLRALAASRSACRRPGRPCPPPVLPAPSSSARWGSALNVRSGSRSPTEVQLTTMSAGAAPHGAAPNSLRERLARARACGSRRAPPRRPAWRSAHTTARARAARAEHERASGRRRSGRQRGEEARRVGVVGVDRAVRRTSACSRRRSPARPRWPRRRARAPPPCAGSSR